MSNFHTHPPGTKCLRETRLNRITCIGWSLIHHDNPKSDELMTVQYVDQASGEVYEEDYRVWKGIYGKTSEKNGTQKRPITLFVPQESFICAITVDDAASTSGQTCTAGLLNMRPEVHKDLMDHSKCNQKNGHTMFTYDIDVSEAKLGASQPQGYYPQIRTFRFAVNHAMNQPTDGGDTGFKSPMSMTQSGGFPHPNMPIGHPWTGDLQYLIPVSTAATESSVA